MSRSFIAITFVSLSCFTWATPDLNEAADDVCECLKAPYAQVQMALELIAAAQASGDTSALVAAQGEMMGVINASNQCFQTLAIKYPEINQSPELQDQVMNIAEQQCPNPAATMMNQ